MPASTVLVFSNPTARYLSRLERLPEPTRIVVGERAEVFTDAAKDADIVLTGGSYRALLEELWPGFRRLLWVHSLAAGLESLLFPALMESPIPLTNSRGVFARSLAEFALAGMLYFAKDLPRMRRQHAAGQWEPFDIEELDGRTLGIFGYGEIGRATAERAKAFGMKVRAVRRRVVSTPLIDVMHRAEDLREMLAASDYLLVCAPLTPETRGSIGEAELRALPSHAVVINLGRGPVIVESALISALRDKHIRGAVLDVFDEEPLPAGHPFYSLDNVLLSPHTADHTATWMEDAMDLFLDNFDLYQRGMPLANVVDKEAGY
jgi:phosphoglycerate dehydrogenase-like enzyme